MNKKILITGGAGFIGFHLARHLKRSGNYRIDLADNFKRGVLDRELSEILDNDKVRLIERDLLSPEWQTGMDTDYDYIYHLAAIIGVTHVQNRPYEVLQNNTLMLLSLCDFARQQKSLSRLIFASTSEIYAGTLQHFSLPIPTPEETPLALTDLNQPRTSYMLSKIYGEALCHHSGLPFTIIRPHNFYGPRMGLSHVIPELLQRAHVSPVPGKLMVFSAEHKRTFCYIEDAVSMIKTLAESDTGKNGVFNIGSQAPEIAMVDLAGLVLKTVGKSLELVLGDTAPGSPVRRCPDMKKTMSATSYTPRYSLEEGISHTYAWYRDNIFEGQELSAK
jgi:nucleoside-diphosphate-sugar epimerase